MKKLIGILIVVNLISCKQHSGVSYNQPFDKNDGLKVSNLSEHHFNKDNFEKISNEVAEGKYGKLQSILLIHNNELIIEQYYNGWNPDEVHYMASTTKSISPILMGIAIDQGKIKDVNQKMLDYFPQYGSLKADSLKYQITIQDLLASTSGFAWDEVSLPITDPENMGVKMDKMDNWLDASLNLPMKTIPGTQYAYSGPNNIIIGEIIKVATGQDVAEFANDNLFKPLGIDNYKWFAKNGIYDLGGGLELKSRDIAKYALLHINKGMWMDKQIVSSDWINKTFTPHIEIKHPLYGGYQWQMVKTEFGFDSWFIPGNGGQIINIVPDLDLVIVINADNKRIPKDERTPLEYLIKDLTKLHPKLNKCGVLLYKWRDQLSN
ncbi:serine hydrolase domain-containing protein [Carboxylicivirga caseinilyticus]|uniref:serine hydrolase domain-containing protein n=1 Tax=Carboxylicivirga caseinilyticus TaxID=3417572 RepID=UPI003D34A9F7|nr:serine hydrolase [Marinilabiliaceae bacterium A049]